MKSLRRRIKSALPPLVVDAIRDLRVLTPPARRAWARAAFHHWRQSDGKVLAENLRAPIEIVTLCYGNIYRSPVAAALLEREAERRGWRGVTVGSAGFVAHEGRPSPDDAQQAAGELGLSLRGHRSTRLTRARADAAGLLVVMDRFHEALLLSEHPHVIHKVVPLWRLAVPVSGRTEVLHDPYGCGIDAVRQCYARIASGVTALADALDAHATMR